jgi:hypothetical protein
MCRALWTSAVTRAVTSLLLCASCGSGRSGAGGADRAPDGGAFEASDEGAAPADDASSYGDDAGCEPGVPRCQGDFGYQMCQDDRTWGGSVSCAGYSANGTSSYCVTIDGWGYCVDPACWYWTTHGILSGDAAVGVCSPDGTFSRCTSAGTLAPDGCDAGCTQVGTLDGVGLGYCNSPCVEGAQECLGGPLYRQCAGGRWSDVPSACAGQGVCNPLAGATPQIRCGGACEPGTSHCNADAGGVETCTDAGQWLPDQTCLLGRCLPGGQQAQCQAECASGQSQCAFDGAGAARSCGDAGLWNSEIACPAGTQCRMSGPVALGCVACVGSATAGGNAFSEIDGTCQGGELSLCGPDNTWQLPSSCGDGGACAQIQQGASSVASCAF